MNKDIQKIYSFLSSMKAGIYLLVAIGIVSGIGASFSPSDFYHSIFFQLLLLLLLLNMTFCTINQIRTYLKGFSKRDNRTSFFRRTGILILHAGIVLILVGGTVNTLAGQSENVNLLEGETLKITDIIPDAKPMELRVDQFTIEFNADDSISQYISSLSLLEEGKVTKQQDISVNTPLNYGGIKAYQSSYGYMIDLEAKSNAGWSEQKLFDQGDVLELKDTGKVLMVYKYIPDYDPNNGMYSKSLRPNNPTVIFSIYENGSMVDVGLAPMGESIEIVPDTYVTFHGVKPYTGLIIKRDPGLALAAAGGLMLMIGACLGLILKVKKQGDVR